MSEIQTRTDSTLEQPETCISIVDIAANKKAVTFDIVQVSLLNFASQSCPEPNGWSCDSAIASKKLCGGRYRMRHARRHTPARAFDFHGPVLRTPKRREICLASPSQPPRTEIQS